MLDKSNTIRILSLLKTLGFDLFTNELTHKDQDGNYLVLEGLEEFREHLGGELTITLLESIGKGCEVHHMQQSILIESIQELGNRLDYPGRERGLE